jgi:hypothetical protein
MTARARTFAAFGAYLCLLTQVMGLLHVLVVRHATCPSHGEIVHGAAPAVAPTPSAADTTVSAAPVADEESDDHCLYVATRRELAGLASGGLAAVSAAATPDVRAPVLPPLIHVPGALVRLAPKTSPPIRAV